MSWDAKPQVESEKGNITIGSGVSIRIGFWKSHRDTAETRGEEPPDQDWLPLRAVLT